MLTAKDLKEKFGGEWNAWSYEGQNCLGCLLESIHNDKYDSFDWIYVIYVPYTDTYDYVNELEGIDKCIASEQEINRIIKKHTKLKVFK